MYAPLRLPEGVHAPEVFHPDCVHVAEGVPAKLSPTHVPLQTPPTRVALLQLNAALATPVTAPLQTAEHNRVVMTTTVSFCSQRQCLLLVFVGVLF